MMTKEEYLEFYPLQVVRIHTEPNDSYEVSLTCGDKTHCYVMLERYNNIFTGSKTDRFEVRPNTYER